MPRRRRHPHAGQPTTDAADRPIAELTLALRIAAGLSQRQALDLAVAWCEGTPTRLPDRGARPAIGYRLPMRSVEGRTSTIRKKLKHGTLRLDLGHVVELALLLRRVR